ncbi:MAG: 2-C-methyl-D-erythritol 4-phosphate cytidylyltransferase [Mycobacterium sp.]
MTAVVPLPVEYAERRDAVFVPVAGLSPLVRVVQALVEVGDVVVAASRPVAALAVEVLVGQDLSGVRVVEAEAPGDRARCVAAGLRAVDTNGHVVLHDIAWPMVGADTLKEIVARLQDGSVAVMPVLPVTDSVKAVDALGVVTATEERSLLRTVQYPRGFAADVLAMLVRPADTGSFDELEAALTAGIPLTLIDGDDEALSVELPGDADYLAAVIAGR